ncbi:TPA: IS1 family transposase, partial [Klebsiella pneumoniae]|nr:IS1 family transposase [Klebsiella pneumoniae]HDZ1397474.1 IS1 family transposase [Klebsiella pneumoniae]
MAKIDVVCPRCSETQGVIRNGHSTSGAQLYRCKL